MLVCAAAELDKVEFVRFKRCTELLALVGVKAFVLELDAVDLDAKNKGGGELFTDFLGDFDDDSCAILERSAVLVGTLVGGWGEELG